MKIAVNRIHFCVSEGAICIGFTEFHELHVPEYLWTTFYMTKCKYQKKKPTMVYLMHISTH